MNKLGHFEENLLTELRQVVAEKAAEHAADHAGIEARRPVRRRRRLVLATAGAGLFAAAIVFGVPAVNGDRAPAAHAVTSNDDGTVTITVNRLEDPDGLERELAAHDITADVSFTPPGKSCGIIPDRVLGAEDRPHQVDVRIDRGDDSLTLRPADLAGRTLVIEGRADPSMPDIFAFDYYVASGPVAPCELVDIPTE